MTEAEIEKVDLASLDIATEKRAELARLFPEVRTEDGKIDFDRLRLALGESVDVGKERYGLTWPGKAACFKTIQAPSRATLRPVPEESVNFETSENLIIEGDNLEVLKLLQKSYLGKVKMIYIDPPYNTGNDFIYPDDYSESLETYLAYTQQADMDGRKWGTNTDTDGRFHSKWLNMMYPRLYLARNLLRDDGVIFISIDEMEVDNLKHICDEIFGEEQFIARFIVQTNPKGRVLDRHVSRTHDYVLVYSRDYLDEEMGISKSQDEIEEDYTEIDEVGRYRALELRNTHRQFNKATRPNLWYPLYVNPISLTVSVKASDSSVEVFPLWEDGLEGCWSWGKPKAHNDAEQLIARHVLGRWKIFRKAYAHAEDGTPVRKKLKSILIDKAFATEKGQASLDNLMGRVFPSPKPVDLLKTLMVMSTNDGDIILDFFAGSASTAHATLNLNEEDGGGRHFILVQLPEPTGRGDYSTITDITKERVRRVISLMNKVEGFRVFKLAESNLKTWNSDVSKNGASGSLVGRQEGFYWQG